MVMVRDAYTKETEVHRATAYRILSESVGFQLSRIARIQRAQWEETLSSVDLKPRHVSVLRAVHESPGVPIRQMAKFLGTDVMSAKRCVDDLEKRGLVTTEQPVSDRRCRVARLTASGREIVDLVQSLVADRESRLRYLFSELEYQTLEIFLRRLEGSFGIHEPDGECQGEVGNR